MNTLCAACGHFSINMFNKEILSPLDQRITQKTTIHMRKSYDSLKSELAKRPLFFFFFSFRFFSFLCVSFLRLDDPSYP